MSSIPSQTPTRLCTFTSTGIVTIKQADNVTKLTFKVVTGPVTMTGNFAFPNSTVGSPIPASPVSLTVGDVFTVESGGPEAPLDGIVIDCSGGEADFVMQL